MKNIRQKTLLDLINNNVIVTQNDLQDALKNAGLNVTQSTISRDIKELRIIKSQDINGVYRYMSPVSSKYSLKDNSKEHFYDMFKKGAVSVDYALNNVVVKCSTGMAQSVCISVDTLFGDRILGSLAGDDTIIIITHSEEDSLLLTTEIKKLI